MPTQRYSPLILTIFFLLLSMACEATQILSLGPEIYEMWRTRENGTKQSGRMDGARLTYDRIAPYCWYLGGDVFASTGRLSGHTGTGRVLRSEFTDFICEGRLGFTLQQCENEGSFIIPFGGYGYFRETNKLRSPAPLLLKFVDTFDYFAAGFLSGVNFTPLLSIGINFKVRLMMNGNSHVTHDPDFEDVNLKMKNEIQVRVETPMTYRFCFFSREWRAIALPFYEYRHFGGQAGFPFDFIDTQFHLLGMRLALAYAF